MDFCPFASIIQSTHLQASWTHSKHSGHGLYSKYSGYRIVNRLVEDGFSREARFVETSNGKKVATYTSLFEKIKIGIDGNRSSVQILLSEDDLWEPDSYDIASPRKIV
jgi:hypothetical protein